jgi:hypothetical protein
VVHLVGRRDDRRPAGPIRVKAYSNRGTPELFVGETSYGPMGPGINRVQYVTDSLLLEPGQYVLRIVVPWEDVAEYEDQYTILVERPR